MTFTGDELFFFVWLPLALLLLAYVAWLECKYGSPEKYAQQQEGER